MSEPSPGELARRLDEIVRLLQGLVSRPEYTEYQRHQDRRFTALEADIADLRRLHEADLKDVRARQDENGKAQGSNFRQAVYSGALPAILCAISVLLALKVGK